MRPWVQYGSSISASGVPYVPMSGLGSQSIRPGGSVAAVSMNAWYSGHDFCVKSSGWPPS